MGKFMSNREKLQYTLTFITDLISLGCSVFLTLIVFDYWLKLIPSYDHSDKIQFYGLLLISFLATFLCFDQTENITRRHWLGELKITFLFNIIMMAVFTTLIVLTKAVMSDSRYLILGLVLSNVALMFLFHQLLKHHLSQSGRMKSMATLAGIVSTTDRLGELEKELRKDWTKAIRGAALLDGGKDLVGTKIQGVTVKAVGLDFMDWVRQDSLDEVYIDIPYDSGTSLLPLLAELESMGVTIHLNVPLIEKLHDRQSKSDSAWYPRPAKSVEEYGDISMITLKVTQRSFSDQVIKRCMDIVGGAIGLILSVPIIAITAIPLKLESPGPLFFKQKRVGLNGRIFEIYKLRSMYVDAEERKKELMAKNEMNGLMFKMTDDPRITKVGKFIRKTSIDELPQFLNVLKGDMSLVGTRPPTLDEYKHYESHHKRRLSMKPGITGMWQVSGRSNIEDFEEVVKLDVAYIDNWSIWMDVKILFKTVMVVFCHVGAK
ncbi:sugar transferase [uncultured Gemmiger sp.]|uniref:sugar transferase n=1 Tax=uncultured Gemmiger sp. TaxID=1623490 RepID=UPI0025FE57B9|nr:sugar transferase [uncultured Gemmiger sp.]